MCEAATRDAQPGWGIPRKFQRAEEIRQHAGEGAAGDGDGAGQDGVRHILGENGRRVANLSAIAEFFSLIVR